MRDLARSMIRFSWAMSVFGAQQAADLFTRPQASKKHNAFDAVSHAAAEEMGEPMKGLYQAGDRLQSGMVETASKLLDGTWSDPGKVMNETWEAVDRIWTGMKSDLSDDSSDKKPAD